MTSLRFFLVLSLVPLVIACERGADEARAHREDGASHQHSVTIAAAKKGSPPEPVPMSVQATGQLGPGRGTLIVDIRAPEGAELTEGAPFRVSARGADLTFPREIDTKLDLSQLPARLPLDVADGAQGPVEVDLSYYFCNKGEDGSCQPERVKLSVEIDMSGGGPGGEAHLVHRPAV